MTVKEISNLTGLSARTLHYYDEIGLLNPVRNEQNDYREYSPQDLDILQQILFFKACGFKLSQIKDIIQNPQFDTLSALKIHKKSLLHEKNTIENMLQTLDKTIQATKGEVMMNEKEKFTGFNFKSNPYQQEARKLWGDKSINYLNALGSDQLDALSSHMDALFKQLSKVSNLQPNNPIVQDEIGKMYNFFNTKFGYHYTPEAFAGVGQMYISDERFKKNIDAYGEGLSEFLAQAMDIFAKNNRK